MLTVKYHADFFNVVEQAVAWYKENAGEDIAEDFWIDVSRTIAAIIAHPDQHSCIQGTNVRRRRLQRFKAYSIQYRYRVNAETVSFLQLFHGSRHPDTNMERFGA